MILSVKLFGPAAEAAGSNLVMVEIFEEHAITPIMVINQLKADRPALAPLLSSARLAVNGDYVASDYPIKKRDELAVIAMVNGG